MFNLSIVIPIFEESKNIEKLVNGIINNLQIDNYEILLVDEVLAVGDYDFQQKCLRKMDEVSREGRTVLIVSHNMASITQLCKRAMLLNSGEIVTVGNAKDVVRGYIEKTGSPVGEAIWPELETAPGDNRLKLHSARILSNDYEVKSTLDIKEEFLIEIKFN